MTPQSVFNQIRTARLYTKDLLGHIDQKDWFRQPTEGVTHVAWQVGHLAVAQYGLGLKRVRGEKPEDADLVPADFRRLFGKGSNPTFDPSDYPTPKEILAVLDRVHEQVLKEADALPQETLQELTGDPPHPMFKTKLGALLWSAQHEFIHAGQLAPLRRLFGEEPLR